jgi:DNA-binding MarR family transcriptional regulator
MEVVGRILFAASLLEERLGRALEDAVTSGGLDVLATLRRQGPPYELTPTALYRELLLSSGAMTHRLDALADRGLVERRPDPDDRRGWLVRLTEAGRALADRLMEARLVKEKRMLATLTQGEQKKLAGLLSKWIASLDD